MHRPLLLLALCHAASLPAQAPRPLVATRDLKIPAGTADLTYVGEMLVTRGGEIIVSQPEDKVIRTFSSTGTPGKFGHAGEGPGEFSNLRLIGLLGDSVWTSDPALERITIFAPDHKLARTFRYPASIVDPGPPRTTTSLGEVSLAGGIFPDGTIRVSVEAPRQGPRPRWSTIADSDQVVIVRITQTGAFKARIGNSPRQSVCMVRFPDYSAFRIPYCAEQVSTMYASTPEFAEATVTNRTTPNRSYHVTVHDANGGVRVSRDVSIEPVVITRFDHDTTDKKWREMLKPEPRKSAAYDKLVWPTTYPPVRAILIGRDGSVWIDERRTSTGHHWLVLDRTGTPVGTVALPESVTVRVADLGALWGLETDADGLQGIVRYRLGGTGGKP